MLYFCIFADMKIIKFGVKQLQKPKVQAFVTA